LATRLETLQRAMAEAVRLQQFERCIGLRDSIRSIEAEMAMQAATTTGAAEVERTTHQHG
jgi:excinuclease UvrABC nuclease subunit